MIFCVVCIHGSRYARIVADAGEKYRVPPQFELVDPRLSTDRLRFL
jgi:hypothetical protein